VTHNSLDDATVDSLEAEWRGDRSSFLVRASAPPDAPVAAFVLQNMTTLRDLDDLTVLIGGLIDSRVRATDVGGYAFRDGDVVAWDAGENQVRVSRAAFTRLLARILDAVVGHGAGADGDDGAAPFVSLAAALRQAERLRLDPSGRGAGS
jgi:hypothetical protein